MATATEIRDRAAQELGVLRLGQSLQAQDATRITTAYTEVYNQLKIDGLATWAFAGEVPTEIVPYVVMLTAHNCLGTYSASPERYQRILNAAGVNGENAIRQIKKFITPFHESQEEPTDY